MKILVTAALPYANGPLHFGHIAGAYLPADCYSRFMRLLGHDVLFVCGSDEHGVAVTMSAEKAGRTPVEQVDLFHSINYAFFQRLHMSFDHYSRTTWKGHVEPSQTFFTQLYENGYIEKKTTDQLYSENDKKFLADRYVVGTCPKCGFEEARGDECPQCGASYEATDLKNPRSKMTGAALTRKPTTHWFLKFDMFKEQLKAWLETKDWKPNVVNFVKHYIDDLRPRAITRDGDWGIPVPLEEAKGKVLYVWFDAPIGYISATQEWAQEIGQKDAWKSFWCDEETKLVHFIGKDNIPFHTIFFPAMLMGQNEPYKLPDDVPANEFYNLEGKQFSKSSGWYTDLDDFFSHFSSDQIRYAIAANAPESQDSEFTWADFQMRCNAELVGKLGNLINRVLVFTQNNCEHTVPPLTNLGEVEQAFIANVDSLMSSVKEAYSTYKLRKASQLLMELAQAGNVFFDAMKPWKLAKDPAERTRLDACIASCFYCLKALALAMFPITPEAAQKLWTLLGYKTPLHTHTWDDVIETAVPETNALPEPSVLFEKVEDVLIQKKQAELCSKNAQESLPTVPKQYEPLKETITIDDFSKVDLRVAKIIEVSRVEKSKKLLKLHVDLGFEKRQVLAGVAKHIESLESLVGKRVVIVANLKPAKLMGIESQGMMLCAGDDVALEPIHIQQAGVGLPVR